MSKGKGLAVAFPVFIMLCVAVLVTACVPWKVNPQSGTLGTVDGVWSTLASYDLDAGDTIFYEYKASKPCWFVITTGGLYPESGEQLNLSGVENHGVFECPAGGTYFLRMIFLEAPPLEGSVDQWTGHIEYESYAQDDISTMIEVAKPVILASLTIGLVLLVMGASPNTPKAHHDAKTDTHGSYWQYYTSTMSNWIAIVAGGALLVVASVIDIADPAGSAAGILYEVLLTVGLPAVWVGLLLSLIITWTSYKATGPPPSD
ncbi:MAG: hypothetical protein AB7S97_03145 [Thermoplasmata archaeon]